MADFLLDATGDLDLSTNDIQFVTDLDEVRQHLQIRYRFFLGEWFLNTDEGTPWQRDVLKKNPNERQIRAMLGQVALDTPGVIEVRSLDYVLVAVDRHLTVTLQVGAEVGGEKVYTDFIVDVEV